jgi:hypothetical protein
MWKKARIKDKEKQQDNEMLTWSPVLKENKSTGDNKRDYEPSSPR